MSTEDREREITRILTTWPDADRAECRCWVCDAWNRYDTALGETAHPEPDREERAFPEPPAPGQEVKP